MSPDLSSDVIAFMRDHADDILKVRFILVLHAAPGGVLSVGDMGYRLDIAKKAVRTVAQGFLDRGIVALRHNTLELTASIQDRLAISELSTCYSRDVARVKSLLRVFEKGDVE